MPAEETGAPSANGRTADHDIDPRFLTRWSPRAFTGEAMPDALLMSLFEAARWAPSASNIQPWRFVYAHRDSPQWEPLFHALMDMNQPWVARASVLAYVISDRFRRRPGVEPTENRSHSFDTGAAWALLALQAQHIGWAAHAMGGFHVAKAHEATDVPESHYRIEAAIAIGRPTDAHVLPESYRAREVPSGREPVAGFVFEGRLRA
ncbi:nitroreductase family protein [Phenylobacterium sp.]|uniref:nitroreductase family protein n=1 Tax=Phenylobacterium sp. TaxID=1871053 RepID=UPI003562D978